MSSQNYLVQFLVELIGTFIFLTIIISTGNALLIGLGLAILITFAFFVTGGYFNPAVTLMFYFNQSIDVTQFILFIVAQFLGGIFAYLFYTYYLKDKILASQARDNNNGVTLLI